MIRIFNSTDRKTRPEETAEIFRLRKRVFHDALEWDVKVTGDQEIDAFDDANPLYVTSISPVSGKMRGALRLLPTLGPNMLADTFSQLLDGEPEIRSAAVWESSRFCIDPDLAQDRSSNQVTVAAAELMCGVGEMGLTSGITHIITVTDVFLERMFRRMGCPGERIGRPKRIGSVIAVAVGWEVTEELLDHMKSVASISGPVLETPMTIHEARQAA
ncbi:acyl-homoserine-lactone synthase [Nitratireductor sp. XY-223]|uniref:acyl-homoserine-lactone synthase n=1 Tax=Nitratireductor sp. XY-223 TaxID=2561926 RepID=UPI0010AAF324|nr:acyl-homoserine-lactone synthase [Nitratireductor sp. XY-223]